mmetsp:Transcript_28720/g.70750  ORF Transcript_28720/g.70750 Transcript_28720/m.70750 type:complete len:83 (+) Transcript_28720:76-324(+)
MGKLKALDENTFASAGGGGFRRVLSLFSSDTKKSNTKMMTKGQCLTYRIPKEHEAVTTTTQQEYTRTCPYAPDRAASGEALK